MPREVTIRQAELADLDGWLDLFESVASEGRWIGAEAPVHRRWAEPLFQQLIGSASAVLFVAEADGQLIGDISIEDHRGCAELGMKVRDGSRGEGVGTALMDVCLDWCRRREVHKVTLEVWPHNDAAIALYRKHGFVVEGRLVRHWRRRNGELWDLVSMGLMIDTSSPGSSHRDTVL